MYQYFQVEPDYLLAAERVWHQLCAMLFIVLYPIAFKRQAQPKIIQVQAMPNDECWQGSLIGLGDDGAVYLHDGLNWTDYAESPKR